MSDAQDKEKVMDEKRKQIADKIIDKMTMDGASQKDINQQKETNKELLGHEGEPDL